MDSNIYVLQTGVLIDICVQGNDQNQIHVRENIDHMFGLRTFKILSCKLLKMQSYH